MAFTEQVCRCATGVSVLLTTLTLFGCSSKPAETTDNRLIGKWELLDGESKGSVAEFTAGGNVLVETKHISRQPQHANGIYTFDGKTLKTAETDFKDDSWWKSTIYQIEFITNDDLVVRFEKKGLGNAFLDSGRWRRFGKPVDATPTGPLADARKRLERLEAKQNAVASLLEKANADRDGLVAKLREAGVESPADLKGNQRAQRLATSVQKINAEIDGLDRQLATIEAALLDAKTVIRRMEREKAGIPEDEMRRLAEQLKEVEERTDGAPLPVTPLDVDSAVERAFKATRKHAQPKRAN